MALFLTGEKPDSIFFSVFCLPYSGHLREKLVFQSFGKLYAQAPFFQNLFFLFCLLETQNLN